MTFVLPSIGSGIFASPTAPPSWNGNTYSLSLDGSNDYIDCGTVSALNSASTFSVSAWYKKASASGGGLIVGVGPFPGERFYIEHFSNNTIYVGYDSTFASVSSTADTNWHHVVYVRDSGTHKLYLDGNDMSLGGTPSSTTGASAGNPFYIGRLNNYSGYFGGLIDEVAVYSSALSSSDVTAIYNSGEPTDLSSYSPVHWWRNGDNDSGSGTTITDQGSGGNDGTLTNGPTFSTDVPFVLPPISNTRSIDFDSTNDYMDCGNVNDLDSATAFSMSLWVLFETGEISGKQCFISSGGDANNHLRLHKGSNHEVRFQVVNAGSGSDISGLTSVVLSENTWHHVAVTYSSGTCKIYIDASLRNTGTTGSASSTNGDDFSIGRLAPYNAHYFGGFMDEVAIWNATLSDADITVIYNSGVPTDLSLASSYDTDRTSNLTHWWRMEEGSGTSVVNTANSGTNDATLNNGPTFSTTVPS